MSRILSEKNHEYNHQQAQENIKEYISQKHLSDPKLHLLKNNGSINVEAVARHFGFGYPGGVRIIRKFFKNESQGFKDSTFKEIAKHTGIHKDYWKGLTTETDEVAYEERLRFEEAFDKLERRQNERHRKEVERYEQFFNALGYRYECSPYREDKGFLHILSRRNCPEEKQELSDEGLDSVIEGLSSMLGYLLYVQQKTDNK